MKARKANALLNKETLGIVIAVSAILISAASFYATYLQATAAEKQVRAMTMPLIRFDSGNVNADNNNTELSYTFANSGVGPALLKYHKVTYNQEQYNSFRDAVTACCTEEYNAMGQALMLLPEDERESIQFLSVTRPLDNVIIAGQSDYTFLRLDKNEVTNNYFELLDDFRWQIDVEICYCSLLDECFYTSSDGIVSPIEQCEIK